MATPAMESSLSRRAALFATAWLALQCRSGKPSGESQAAQAAHEPGAELPFGGLEMQQVSTLGEDQRGGTALVLLHGYGAPGDDLVSLAKELLRPGMRCIVPAAPLSVEHGGRAWWQIDAVDHPRYVTDEPWPSNIQPPSSPELVIARAAVAGLIAGVREKYAPERLYFAGFSQGAMLALDLFLADGSAIDRVAVLSGALLIEAAQRLARQASSHRSVFISHGRQDRRLPYAGAELMRSELEAHGYPVTFRPFDGPHAIPPQIVSELAAFLAA